jgi:hypothetical protein
MRHNKPRRWTFVAYRDAMKEEGLQSEDAQEESTSGLWCVAHQDREDDDVARRGCWRQRIRRWSIHQVVAGARDALPGCGSIYIHDLQRG